MLYSTQHGYINMTDSMIDIVTSVKPHTAGIMARSDLLQDHGIHLQVLTEVNTWESLNLRSNPKQISRDDLYRARINPIVTFQTRNSIVW